MESVEEFTARRLDETSTFMAEWDERAKKGARMFRIVSRHPAAVAFIRQAALTGEIERSFAFCAVVSEISLEEIRKQNIRWVAGNLPMHLAARVGQLIAVEFEGQPPRGADLTDEGMRQAGAVLRRYTVQSHPLSPRTSE